MVARRGSNKAVFASKSRRFLWFLLLIFCALLAYILVFQSETSGSRSDIFYAVGLDIGAAVAILIPVRGTVGAVIVTPTGMKVRNLLRTYFVSWDDFSHVGIAYGEGLVGVSGPALWTVGGKCISLVPMSPLFVIARDDNPESLSALTRCIEEFRDLKWCP